MTRRTPKVAVHLYEDELGRMISLLSPEAAGFLLRILDLQHKTGAGLPDDKSTHLVLGLQRRRWLLIRNELLRVMELRDGKIAYTPMLDRFASQRDARINRTPAQASAATTGQPKKTKPATKAHQPVEASAKPAARFADNGDISFEAPRRPKASPPPQGTALTPPYADTPTSPFAVMDKALENAGEPKVVALDSARRERQPKLPGFAQNAAAADGRLDDIPSPKKLSWDLGVQLLVRCNGLKEHEARRRIGKLMSEYDVQYVYAAIADAIQHKDNIVDPWSWIVRNLKDNFPDKATSKANRIAGVKGGKRKPAIAAKPAPKATPDFMGMSAERAARLRERSNAIRKGTAPVPANQDLPAHAASANTAAAGDPISAPIAL